MQTVKGIYKNGQLLLDEPIDTEVGYKVFVTFVEKLNIQTAKRKAGALAGILKTPDNFNDPIDDLKEYM